MLVALVGAPLPRAAADAGAVERTASHAPAAHENALAEAVGRLLIPAIRYEDGYARHYDEQCTASVVAPGEEARSRYLLSAWHCLEDYRDLSRPLLFETASGGRHPVRIIATGGGMDRDWALLGLRRELAGALALAPASPDHAQTVSLVGYPRNADLTVLRNCVISGEDGRDRRTPCVMQRGASGGAVVSDGARPRLLGVISRGDGVTQSIFVPLASFYPRIRAHLAGTP